MVDQSARKWTRGREWEGGRQTEQRAGKVGRAGGRGANQAKAAGIGCRRVNPRERNTEPRQSVLAKAGRRRSERRGRDRATAPALPLSPPSPSPPLPSQSPSCSSGASRQRLVQQARRRSGRLAGYVVCTCRLCSSLHRPADSPAPSLVSTASPPLQLLAPFFVRCFFLFSPRLALLSLLEFALCSAIRLCCPFLRSPRLVGAAVTAFAALDAAHQAQSPEAFAACITGDAAATRRVHRGRTQACVCRGLAGRWCHGVQWVGGRGRGGSSALTALRAQSRCGRADQLPRERPVLSWVPERHLHVPMRRGQHAFWFRPLSLTPQGRERPHGHLSQAFPRRTQRRKLAPGPGALAWRSPHPRFGLWNRHLGH